MSGKLLFGIALLTILALIAGFASTPQRPPSSIPSISNADAQGFKVLATYLTESNFNVAAWESSYDKLNSEIKTLVIPVDEFEFTNEHVAQLSRFVSQGGICVFLVKTLEHQVTLNEWIQMRGHAFAGDSTAHLTNSLGPFSNVTALSRAPFFSLFAQSDEVTLLSSDDAVAFKMQQSGAVFVLAGTEVARNSHVFENDNLQWWVNLASLGPMRFDEFALSRKSVNLPLGVRLTLVQLVLVGIAFAFSQGIRFFKPFQARRNVLPNAHAYRESLAALMAAQVDEESAVIALQHILKLKLKERLGIQTTEIDGVASAASARWPEISEANVLGAFAPRANLIQVANVLSLLRNSK
jgi:hypothetical protein